MAVPPVLHARLLLAVAALAEAEPAAIAAHRIALRLRRRVQPVGPVPGVGAAKLVQYDVLLPPDNAVDIAKFVQFDVLVPPDNAVDIGKFVQFVALVPPDNAVAAAKSVQYAVLEAPPPVPRPPVWNSALVLSDLSGEIAPAPVPRRQNGAVPAAPVTWLPRAPPLALMAAALPEPEPPSGALWPLWGRDTPLDAIQGTAASSGAPYWTKMLAAATSELDLPAGLLFGRRSTSFDSWGQYPLPVPPAALIHAWITNNLPDDDPPWALWTRRFLAADTYHQRQLPVRPLFWRMGTGLTFPEPRVDLRKFVQKGRPPFNEYDPVIIVN